MISKDRPSYKLDNWLSYFSINKNHSDRMEEATLHYNYIKSVESIRDLTDSEYWYARAYDKVILGIGG